MYLWRRRATKQWWTEHEPELRARFGNAIAVIERPDRKRLEIEIATESPAALREFGGRAKKLPRDWLRRFERQQKATPIKIGKRLLINVGGTSVFRQSRHRGRSHLVIPAGAAFGTGEHATTGMCLRMLTRMFEGWGAHAARVPRLAARQTLHPTRQSIIFSASRRKVHAGRVRSPEVVVDLGTGSGILALAASLLGAKRVIAIDHDPVAIRVAKENARRNKIDNVAFRVAEVRACGLPRRIDIVTANLFSEVLIEILPRLRGASVLILSGILREQQREVARALQRRKIDICDVRRRGNWVAILARKRVKFCGGHRPPLQ